MAGRAIRVLVRLQPGQRSAPLGVELVGALRARAARPAVAARMKRAAL